MAIKRPHMYPLEKVDEEGGITTTTQVAPPRGGYPISAPVFGGALATVAHPGPKQTPVSDTKALVNRRRGGRGRTNRRPGRRDPALVNKPRTIL
jgi:hypothetical protein